MKRQVLIALAATAGALLAPPAAAQTAAPECPAGAAKLPSEFAGWAAPAAVVSGVEKRSITQLTLGGAVAAKLHSTADMHYVTQPAKPGGSVSYGGLFAFTIKEAGSYRVALGSGAWIDVLKGSKAVESTAHGHGPECSGIHKMVDFPLTPGRYVLQVAANGSPDLTLMVLRLR